MASLNGQTIASSYEQLLHTDTDGGGNGNTLVTIKDGDNGTTFGLKLATNKVEVIPSAADDANAFEVSKNDGTAVFTVNSSPPSATLAGTLTATKALSSDTQTTPETILTLGATYANTGTDGGAGSGSRIEFQIPDDETNPITGAAIAGIKEAADDSDASAGMAFYVSQNDTTLDEVVRIDHDGKVGIGETSPSQTLHIKGASNTGGIRLANTGFAYYNEIRNNGDGLLLDIDKGDAGGAGADLRINISDSEKMRITNDGNVGLGATSPNTALHLKFTDNTTNAADNSSLTHSSGIYINNESTTNEAHSSVGFRTNNLDGALSMIYGGSANEGRMSVNMEGAERLSVTHDGKVFIGSTSSRALSGVNAQLQVEGTTYSTSSAHLIGNTGTDASTAPILFFGRSRGTSDGSSTSVASGDRLGALFFCGADGTDINTPAATIQVSVDETPGSNDMPGRIEFRTTADGASSTTERMRITSRGDVGIGDTAPTTALTNFGSASRGLSIKNVQPTIALPDTDPGSGHFWIANAGGISYFQNNVSGATYRFYVESTIALEIENDGVLKSSDGIEFEGTALGSGQTGIASSGDGGDLRIYTNGTESWNFATNGNLVSKNQQNGLANHIKFAGSATYANSASTVHSLSGSGAIIIVTNHSNDSSALFHMDYDHSTVTMIANPGGVDSDGFNNADSGDAIRVFKSAGTFSFTVKNSTGAQKNIGIGIISMHSS